MMRQCSSQYAYSKLPIKRDGLESFCDNIKITDLSKEGNENRSNSQRLIELIRKGVNKLGNFLLNCIYIQPSSNGTPEYIFPDPYTYYVLEGLAYW